MAHLETLKVVAKPNFNPTTAEERRRHKLIVKLQEQLCLAEAQLGGSPYTHLRHPLQMPSKQVLAVPCVFRGCAEEAQH